MRTYAECDWCRSNDDVQVRETGDRLCIRCWASVAYPNEFREIEEEK